MEKEMLKSKVNYSNVVGSIDSSLVVFDLPTLIEKIKHKSVNNKVEVNSMILLNNKDKQIILTTLHEGTEIKSLQKNNSVTFQIIEGNLMLHVKKESINLSKGQLLTLTEKIKYSVSTNVKTVLLLTIANSLKQTAVKKTLPVAKKKRRQIILQ